MQISERHSEHSPNDRKTIVLVAKHIGTLAGGEAIKASQYAKFLKEADWPLKIIAHERSKTEMGADPNEHEYHFVTDTLFQRFLWTVPILRPGLEIYFHLRVRQIVKRIVRPNANTIIHYISPISPVTPRFPPRGYRIIMGPLAGDIYYPPAFWDRMPLKDRLRSALHKLSQRVLGVVARDKRVAEKVLVSGYERTRKSLKLAGCTDPQMVDTIDSGVNEKIARLPRVIHEGENFHFMCSGRFVPVKAFDLAIKALAKADPRAELTFFGDGADRGDLEQLSRELDVADRVHFYGWASHDEIIAAYPRFRGYLFPSLADSNGIVMQEAMMAGLPVVAQRWGGPAGLADDETAIYVDPISESHVIQSFAQAIDQLAQNPELAEGISKAARQRAMDRFTWEAVSAEWMKVY